ncbi:MAG: alpha/beta hydrolase [Candidatus Krumholzibacteria bacterium]|nr:alpha/beta hydrolase [Candidatus Krumholzibacteria bacterium]
MMIKRTHGYRNIVLALAVVAIFSATATAQEEPRQGPPEIHEGRGEHEMILIHGLGGDADIWDDCLPYLKGTFKVWTFELAGHGRTRPIPSPTIGKEVERLGAFIKDQGITYPTLVGHAMGGMIALRYTIDHPADVGRLIVLDAAPLQLASEEQKAAVGIELANDYDKFVYSRFINMTPNQEITERIVDTALRTDSATFISLLMSSFDFDVSGQLYSMPVPMLVVGSELMFPGKDQSKHQLEHYGFGKARSLSFKRMGGTGHFMMLERPVYLASVLLAFGVSADPQFDR